MLDLLLPPLGMSMAPSLGPIVQTGCRSSISGDISLRETATGDTVSILGYTFFLKTSRPQEQMGLRVPLANMPVSTPIPSTRLSALSRACSLSLPLFSETLSLSFDYLHPLSIPVLAIPSSWLSIGFFVIVVPPSQYCSSGC
jgi:hypothetical protein